MSEQAFPWELTILDAAPPVKEREGYYGFNYGDFNNDGAVELIASGNGALVCYQLDPPRREVIAKGDFCVGVCAADFDGDGILEVLTGYRDPMGPGRQCPRTLAIYKHVDDHWEATKIAVDQIGHFHDIIAYDIDGDGELEIIANLVSHSEFDGLYIYDRRGTEWVRHVVQNGFCEEGLCTFRLTPDEIAIASGVHVYRCPKDGPYSGLWEQHTFAPDHREMVRLKPLEIAGSGVDDLVIVDSEYLEGKISWIENRFLSDSKNPWLEHHIEGCIYYGHTLDTERDPASGTCRIVLGEMAGGGWNAPFNHDARIIRYTTESQGRDWKREIMHRGQGTHEARLVDLDGQGEKILIGKEHRYSRVMVWRQPRERSILEKFGHTFIDLDFYDGATDILATDIDGDGREDIVTGKHWYHNPTWRRFPIPDISQVINAYDIDGDGRKELICTLPPLDKPNPRGLSNRLVWIKPIDPFTGKWEIHEIGTGIGDWPHGSLVAPLFDQNRPALVTSYHSAHSRFHQDADPPHYPEIWEIPANPKELWRPKPLVDIKHGEEMLALPLAGSGRLDVVLGSHWLENQGNGTFVTHPIADLYPARLATADISGRGRFDLITADEVLDFENKVTPWSYLRWLECPANPKTEPWIEHVIDRVRCGHSLGAADLDGDGEAEIICGEHDPYYPYRSRSHLYIYKKADPEGRTWKRYTLDDRFEHHDGCKIIDLGDGRRGIVSIGWNETYVHLWAPPA